MVLGSFQNKRQYSELKKQGHPWLFNSFLAGVPYVFQMINSRKRRIIHIPIVLPPPLDKSTLLRISDTDRGYTSRLGEVGVVMLIYQTYSLLVTKMTTL